MTKESLESPLSFEFICLEFGDKCITNFKLPSKIPFNCGEIVCGNHSHATKTHRVVKTNTQHKYMNIIPQSLYGSIDQEMIHSTIWWSMPHTWGLDDDSSEFRSYRIHFSSIHSGADWWVGLIKGGIDWGGSNSGPICPVHLHLHWAQMLSAANEGWKANTGKAKPHRQTDETFLISLSITENIARIANAVQVTICLLVSTSVY